MKQLLLGLEWLTDSNWMPETVLYNGKKEMSNDAFDDYFAQNMGHDSYADLVTHENAKHNRQKLQYGDKILRLIK